MQTETHNDVWSDCSSVQHLLPWSFHFVCRTPDVASSNFQVLPRTISLSVVLCLNFRKSFHQTDVLETVFPVRRWWRERRFLLVISFHVHGPLRKIIFYFEKSFPVCFRQKEIDENESEDAHRGEEPLESVVAPEQLGHAIVGLEWNEHDGMGRCHHQPVCYPEENTLISYPPNFSVRVV